MRKVLWMAVWAPLVFACTYTGTLQEQPLYEGVFPSVRAEGWMETFLERQRCGLSGHPEALSYPYNTCLWSGEIPRQGSHGEDWWRYEQTAYYTDGLLKLAYLTGDDSLADLASRGILYTLDHQLENGLLGVEASRSKTRPERVMWPHAVFFRAMKTYFEKTRDERVPLALEKYYLHYTPQEIGQGRNVVNVEGMVWTWRQTGNRELLDRACEAILEGEYEAKPALLESGDPLHIHGVTFCEYLKLPIILYEATRDSLFLGIARRMEANLSGYNLLPDGVPTSVEWVQGKDLNAGHETCDIADYTWSLGYYLMALSDPSYADAIERAVFNALPGAVTKDFKALQYFSNLNQFIVTGESDPNLYRRGSTWSAYRPTHETECCAGNVHRVMPNYISRMWLDDGDGGLVAALYGPSSVCYKGFCIREETSYPFDNNILFAFSGKEGRLPFSFRIPGWASGFDVKLNGRSLHLDSPEGKFITVRRKWKRGDTLSLHFDAKPQCVDAEGQGYIVQRGPLLYSYPIPQRKEEDLKEYAAMNGKHPDNPDFKSWAFFPAGPFNYALAGPEVEEVSLSNGGYPLDAPPIGLRVPVREIDWPLEEGRFTPRLPSAPKKGRGEIQYITLVPYGCTELRLTVFPYLIEE